MFKVCDLSLLMAIGGSFDSGTERAIVLIIWSDCHVIEATVRYTSHAYFVDGSICGAISPHTLNLTIVNGSLVCYCLFFYTCIWLYTLLTTDGGTTTPINSLVIPSFLQLLTLFKIAQLITVRDQQVAAAVLIVSNWRCWLVMVLVLKTWRISQGLPFLYRLRISHYIWMNQLTLGRVRLKCVERNLPFFWVYYWAFQCYAAVLPFPN